MHTGLVLCQLSLMSVWQLLLDEDLPGSLEAGSWEVAGLLL